MLPEPRIHVGSPAIVPDLPRRANARGMIIDAAIK